MGSESIKNGRAPPSGGAGAGVGLNFESNKKKGSQKAPLRPRTQFNRSKIDFRPKLDNAPGGCGQGLAERTGLDVFEIHWRGRTYKPELGMVENVKCFQAQFDPSGFGPSESLGQNEIGIVNAWPVKIVSALVAKLPERFQRESVRVEVVIRPWSRAPQGSVNQRGATRVVNPRIADYIR